jgi:hypothetical protein
MASPRVNGWGWACAVTEPVNPRQKIITKIAALNR